MVIRFELEVDPFDELFPDPPSLLLLDLAHAGDYVVDCKLLLHGCYTIIFDFAQRYPWGDV